MTPPRPRSEPAPTARYQEVLDVAARLFSEHGYNGTSVRLIADRLGILSGSLYSHVASKEDLLRQIALRVGGVFLDRAEAALVGVDSPEDRLRAICRSHLQVLHDEHVSVTVYYSEWRHLDPPAREDVVALRDRYQRVFRETVEDGVSRGTFAIKDVRAAVLVILSVLNWTYQWYRADGPVGPVEIADGYVDVLLYGILRRD